MSREVFPQNSCFPAAGAVSQFVVDFFFSRILRFLVAVRQINSSCDIIILQIEWLRRGVPRSQEGEVRRVKFELFTLLRTARASLTFPVIQAKYLFSNEFLSALLRSTLALRSGPPVF